MPETLSIINGFRVLICESDGEVIQNERSAVDLIGEAFGEQAEVVVIPAERLGDDFFRLRTRIAGDIAQKFVTYQLLLVVVGDISRHTAESSALQDFVTETNQGDHVWFLPDVDALDERLARHHRV
ncbi:DUF4180 domain-containing protein [Sphaerisporangium corydalis]|uniref:DUF4180 domain-containing protein n=1 Tax=Sphaerisporangium corydalis TaxID=1441875 RepID=A0ABV9EBV7_9ACTN|nr:DUF4180 domain-containing protein [Sphaerisporangium corydalis]